VDTASIYNNIGVLFFKLGRIEEAVVWIDLCITIMEEFMQPGNPRLQMCKENAEKINKFGVKRLNDLKTWWIVVKNKKAGGKKKKGGKKRK